MTNKNITVIERVETMKKSTWNEYEFLATTNEELLELDAILRG